VVATIAPSADCYRGRGHLRRRKVLRAVSLIEVVSYSADAGNSGNALPSIQFNRAIRRIAEGLGAGGHLVAITVDSAKWAPSGMALWHQPGGADER
jgi:hypothetical protein